MRASTWAVRHGQRSGIWRVELENGVPRLVLYCGREGGVHHFDLGAVSASYVTCNGRRYTLVK